MVCAAEKNILEKKGLSFDSHVAHEHDFWKYCNYLAFLSQKDPEEFTGLENLVWACFQNKDTSWIPQAEDN